VDELTASLPEPIAADLVSAGLADRPLSARGGGSTVDVAIQVVGIAADAASLAWMASATPKVLKRMVAYLRRETPEATQLSVQVGSSIKVIVNLDDHAQPADAIDEAAVAAIAALVDQVAAASNDATK
jgi:hypothetical protein